jgi:hypothetical protein
MTTSFVRHTAADYVTWREHSDAFQKSDAAASIKCDRVFQSTEDPNDVTVIHEFDSLTDAQALLDSPELVEAMTAAGVQGEPQIWLPEEAD